MPQTKGQQENKNSMSLDEKEKGQMRYSALLEAIRYAEVRENTYSSKFVDSEIQIASIVLGILGATALLGGSSDLINPSVLWIAIVGVLFLVGSLIIGLWSVSILKRFWSGVMKQQRMTFDIWQGYLLNGGNYKQADTDSKVVRAGAANIVESPNWPHILQTVLLVAGLILSIGGIMLSKIGL